MSNKLYVVREEWCEYMSVFNRGVFISEREAIWCLKERARSIQEGLDPHDPGVYLRIQMFSEGVTYEEQEKVPCIISIGVCHLYGWRLNSYIYGGGSKHLPLEDILTSIKE